MYYVALTATAACPVMGNGSHIYPQEAPSTQLYSSKFVGPIDIFSIHNHLYRVALVEIMTGHSVERHAFDVCKQKEVV